MKILVNIARLIVGLTFVLSGSVKAIDPVGTQYKLQDYAEAMGLGGILPDGMMLAAALLLITMEVMLGVWTLVGMHRKFTSRLLWLVMLVMTGLTVWIYAKDPVQDCGCFGDAIVLTNGQTLLKNIVLMALVTLMAWRPMMMPRLIWRKAQWIITFLVLGAIVAVAGWALYRLPLIDFRPYHIGADIKKSMEMPKGAKGPEYETTFIMEKNGDQKEFTLDDYPDSTWTFVDSKSKIVKEGYVPPIHDFAIQRIEDGEDITDEVLSHKGRTILIVAPHLEKADIAYFGELNELYDRAKAHQIPFYMLTASNEEAIGKWKDETGAEYPFCQMDDITLKTMIRQSPGIIVLKDGRIEGKHPAREAKTIVTQ